MLGFSDKSQLQKLLRAFEVPGFLRWWLLVLSRCFLGAFWMVSLCHQRCSPVRSPNNFLSKARLKELRIWRISAHGWGWEDRESLEINNMGLYVNYKSQTLVSSFKHLPPVDQGMCPLNLVEWNGWPLLVNPPCSRCCWWSGPSHAICLLLPLAAGCATFCQGHALKHPWKDDHDPGSAWQMRRMI